MAESHEDLPAHFGPPEFIETTKEGTRIGGHIHNADTTMSDDQLRETLAETHGLNPEDIDIKHRRDDVMSRARNTVSFSGGWDGSKWEPEGPTPNYGYKPSMN